MCRLLLANREGIMALHEKLKGYTIDRGKQAVYIGGKTYFRRNYPNGLLDHLQDLEDSLGGHGNGVVLVKDGNVIFSLKGMKVTVEDTFKPMLEKDYDYVVWHTRLCSSGSQSDKNCHPFVMEWEKHQLVWAMNGTETTMTRLGELMGDVIDTEAIGIQALKLGLPIPKAFSMYHSVFVGTYNGKPFAVKNSGELERFRQKGGWVFASKFPTGLGEYLGYSFVFDNGKETSTPVTTGASKSNFTGGWYSDGYGYEGDYYTRSSGRAVRDTSGAFVGTMVAGKDYPDFRNHAYKKHEEASATEGSHLTVVKGGKDVSQVTEPTKNKEMPTIAEVENDPELLKALTDEQKQDLIRQYYENQPFLGLED